MTTTQAIDLMRELGPALLAIVGVLLSSLLAVVGFMARQIWAAHKGQIKAVAKLIAELGEELKTHSKNAQNENLRLWEAVQALRAEVQLAKQANEHLKSVFMSVEGAIQMQHKTITEYTAQMVRTDGKLEAVFRILDAKARASDLGR